MAQESLGQILIRAGFLDEAGLERALKEQKRWGGDLARHLVDAGLVDEEIVIRALSTLYRLPAVVINPEKVKREVARIVPREVAERHGLVAFRVDARRRFLDVAMSDPSNLAAVDEVRIATQYNVRVNIAARDNIARALRLCYDDRPADVGGTVELEGDEVERPAAGGPESGAALPHDPLAARGAAVFDSRDLRRKGGALPVDTELVEVHTSRNGEPRAAGARETLISVELEPIPGPEPASEAGPDEGGSPAAGGTGGTRPVRLPTEAEVVAAVEELDDRLVRVEEAVATNRTVLEKMLRALLKAGVLTREQILKMVEPEGEGS